MVSGNASPAAPAPMMRGVRDDDPSEHRRVVITGLGAVSAAGSGVPELWSALVNGKVCTSEIDALEAGRTVVAGQVADAWRGPEGVPAWLTARMDRSSRLALDAALQAHADARIAISDQTAFAVGAITGTAHPGQGNGWQVVGSGLAGASLGLNIAGPTFTVTAGGASGLTAVVVAAQLIRSGVIRAAIAVGAEAPLTPEIWSAYDSLGLLDRSGNPSAQRPFDADRAGIVLGEGAAALMLEDRQLAAQRGARIYAEIGGEAMSSGPMGDGMPPTDIEVARRTYADAMLAGEISPSDVDVLVTAGVGTTLGDERETDIIERAFGRRVLDMYATAVSPNVGYTLGAAGALSAVAGALIVDRKQVPPHATYETPDIACKLGFTQRLYEDQIVGAAVAAYGAHGQNAALILLPHASETGDEIPLVIN